MFVQRKHEGGLLFGSFMPFFAPMKRAKNQDGPLPKSMNAKIIIAPWFRINTWTNIRWWEETSILKNDILISRFVKGFRRKMGMKCFSSYLMGGWACGSFNDIMCGFLNYHYFALVISSSVVFWAESPLNRWLSWFVRNKHPHIRSVFRFLGGGEQIQID